MYSLHQLSERIKDVRANCYCASLRWRNTRYKNPQLVAQHCFVASFCRCLPVFHLARSTWPPNKNICCRLKKVVARGRARVYFEQQILALLLVFHQTHNLSRNKFARALANQPISSPHFFNPQPMFLLRGQVDRARWKTGNIDENLQRNNVARQVEGFCISWFAAFTAHANSNATSCIEHALSIKMNNDIRQMAIVMSLLGFYDLGRSVTPTFHLRNRFYLQLSPLCPKRNKKSIWEVKKISRFLSTGHVAAARRVKLWSLNANLLCEEHQQLTKFA